MLSREQLNKVKNAIDIEFVSSGDINNLRYDLVDGHVAGSRRKEFVRTDSKNFQKLFDEIKNNPNCSYITYANSVIKEGFLPQKLSVLIKYLDSTKYFETDSDYYIVQEILSGQLLNYYGAGTCYNMGIYSKTLDEYMVMSVDFATPDSEFYTFDDLNFVLGRNICRDIDYQLPELYKIEELAGVKKEEIDKICEDYMYSALIRLFVLRDGDFAHTNCGFIKHNNGKVQFVNFDFEFSFDDDFYDNCVDDKSIRLDLKTIKNAYPKAFERFIEKSKELYEGLMEWKGKISCPIEEHAKCLDLLIRNLQQVLKIEKTIENKKTM